MTTAAPPFDLARTRVTVFEALLRARDQGGGRKLILEDHDRKPLSYDGVIRAAFALGGRLARKTRPRERVGLLLPTGVACTASLFALFATGRVATMLNFTAGAANLRAACQAAGVRRVITARRFIDQANLGSLVESLAAHAEITLLEDVRAEIRLADKLAAAAKALAPRAFDAPAGPDDEAVILFTSGSFGAPRGVVLSHANLVANVEQAAAHVPFKPDWVFFNALPMFHAFGLTAGTLLPLLTNHKAVLYPSPLHHKEIPKLIAEVQANVTFTTDTFANAYARSAAPGALRSLELAVLGAERVREETRRAYEALGVTLLEGYGCTECAPILACNKPDANRAGTVGPFFAGLERRLEPVPGIHEGERLYVRGPNVMLGYLGEDGAIEAPPEGWHDTGDIVRVEEDGFVSIHGRAKRFAKVAGEMVSLAAVEAHAAAVWPHHRHAAIALPDARRGERVVLVTDNPAAELETLHAHLRAHGAPEVAGPRRLLRMAELPMLGSGKTDYVAIREAALEDERSRAQAA